MSALDIPPTTAPSKPFVNTFEPSSSSPELSPPLQASAVAPLVRGDPQEKYLSLGPNIYGLVKTFYATYTYLTTNPIGGATDESLEVITQVSTKIFSTSRLPASISLATIEPTAALQLDKDSLLTIKESYNNNQGWEQGYATPDITASYTQLQEHDLIIDQTTTNSIYSDPHWSFQIYPCHLLVRFLIFTGFQPF